MTAAPATAANKGHTHSPNFAGYEVNLAPTFGEVRFFLPGLSCDDTDSGVVPNLTLTNFDTNDFTSGGVAMQCVGGVASYTALVEINNQYSFPTPTMTAGDQIDVQISAVGATTSVVITDMSKGSSVTDTVHGPGGGGVFTGASAGVVKIGSPGLPIPQFGSIGFSLLRINRTKVPLADVSAPNDMYDGSTLQVAARKLTVNGKFATAFAHA